MTLVEQLKSSLYEAASKEMKPYGTINSLSIYTARSGYTPKDPIDSVRLGVGVYDTRAWLKVASSSVEKALDIATELMREFHDSMRDVLVDNATEARPSAALDDVSTEKRAEYRKIYLPALNSYAEIRPYVENDPRQRPADDGSSGYVRVTASIPSVSGPIFKVDNPEKVASLLASSVEKYNIKPRKNIEVLRGSDGHRIIKF